MTHTIFGQAVDVPEVDAFLNDYRVVCRKHGVMLGWYEVRGGGWGPRLVPNDPINDLMMQPDLEKSGDVPFVRDAIARAEEMRALALRRAAEQRQRDAQVQFEQATAQRRDMEDQALREGVTFSDGRRFKLVPVDAESA